MALTPAELSAKVDTLQVALDSEQEQIASALQTLKDANAALQAIIDAGLPGSDGEALQAIGDKIDSAISDLSSTIPDA